MSNVKSDEISAQFRAKGNQHFVKREFYEALFEYNKALSFAKSNEALALCCANRSAVYLEDDCYNECLKNIHLAFNNYPKEKIQKLKDRLKKCKQLMKAYKSNAINTKEFTTLSYPANPKIPFVADGIECRVTEKFGRGIWTTRDLKPGDIIAIDTAPMAVLKFANYNRCCNCSKKSMFNLIPCLKTTSVMYCSEKCRDEIYRKFGDMKVLPVGVEKFLMDLYDAFGSREKLIEQLKITFDQKSLLTAFDCDFSDGPDHPKYKENAMKCFLNIHSMKCNCYHGILSDNRFGKHKMIDRICKHFQWAMPQSKDQEFNPGIIHGLFNHSCDYNVHSIEKDNQWIHTVLKPIKAGEQLFRVYHFDHDSTDFFCVTNTPLNKRAYFCSCYYCVNKIEPKDFVKKDSFELSATNIGPCISI